MSPQKPKEPVDHAHCLDAPTSARSAPTPTSPARPDAPPRRTPVTTLIAHLKGVDVDAVEGAPVGVREAWHRGDQAAIADALIAQATLLETLGAKLLRVAGERDTAKTVEIFCGLALRALEQARKTWATLAGLREKPRIQTNVQVNVAGPTNEVLEVRDGQ